MRGHACKKTASPFTAKTCRNNFCGQQTVHPKARHQQRMGWDREYRSQYLQHQLLPVLYKWQHQIDPDVCILTQGSSRVLESALQCDRGSVVKRVGQWSRRVNPFKAVLVEW